MIVDKCRGGGMIVGQQLEAAMISDKERLLLDTIRNLLGAFDTPVRRLKFPSKFGDDVCSQAAEVVRELDGEYDDNLAANAAISFPAGEPRTGDPI